MNGANEKISDKALDSLSVTPPEPQNEPMAGDAGQDESIRRRLRQDPENLDARLDTGLDESMDASDPPSSALPAHNKGPAPSSGYDADAERDRKR